MSWYFSKFNWLKLKIEMEKNMSKKSKVQWQVRDGVKPTQRESDGCFELRSPLEFVISPGVKQTIGLGLRCSHAVHIIPAWEPKKKGLNLVDGIWAAQDANPEYDLQVTVINDSSAKVFIERGDILARCVVFSNQNLDVEYLV